MNKTFISRVFLSVSILFCILLIVLFENRLFRNIIILGIFFLNFCFFYFSYRKDIDLYFRDVKLEFGNIIWSKISDVRQTTIVILSIIFLTSLFLWIVDSILTYLVSNFI